MITREEALQMTHNCRITSLGEFAHGFVIYQIAAKEIINQLFDQQDQLQQHIKSLEAQLSNTEQLTCEDCSLYGANFGNGYDRNYCTKLNMFTNDGFGCILYKKDTQ